MPQLTRGTTLTAATAALLAVAALVLAPAARAEPDRGERVERAQARLGAPASGWSAPQASWADAQCSTDPPGDTFREGAGEQEIPFESARGDIREICADYGQVLVTRLRFAEPTDPAGDPNWQGETSVFWFVDTGGGTAYDRVVAYEPGPQVTVLGKDGEGQWTVEHCDGQAAFDQGYLVARTDPGPCLGAPDRIVVGAVTAYDTDASDEGAPIAIDVSDYEFAVGRTGASTLRTADRLAGESRFATAVAISRARFTGRTPAVYLARADDFADALAAGALSAAAATDGPVLLVPTCGTIPGIVLDEIARLDPSEVVALGGQAAVCDGVLAAAAGAGNVERPTDRLEHPDEPTRWGTAVAISQRAYPVGGVEEVYLATGQRFPDALAAGSLDAGPVLLVPACGSLPGVVATEIDRLDPERVVALGGETAVCEALVDAAATAGGGDRGTDRLAGATRFDTAAEVSAYRFPTGADRVYVARADDFPDALAGGVLQGGPILLVPRCGDLPAPIAREIRRLDPDRVTGLGGQQAVCEQTLRHAANA